MIYTSTYLYKSYISYIQTIFLDPLDPFWPPWTLDGTLAPGTDSTRVNRPRQLRWSPDGCTWWKQGEWEWDLDEIWGSSQHKLWSNQQKLGLKHQKLWLNHQNSPFNHRKWGLNHHIWGFNNEKWWYNGIFTGISLDIFFGWLILTNGICYCVLMDIGGILYIYIYIKLKIPVRYPLIN